MPIKKLLERNALFIAIFVSISIALLSLVSLKEVHLIKSHNSDKYGHFLAYFILSLSWLNVFKKSLDKNIINYIIIFLLICYGIILEVLQDILTTHRQADLYDIFANSAGVIFAVILFNKMRKKNLVN